ncbi:hypothetical protein N7519_000123 [Penicillium mononematosum]|nr:hypothetical protein N7519_000123 [Penicillium mononematosum]
MSPRKSFREPAPNQNQKST